MHYSCAKDYIKSYLISYRLYENQKWKLFIKLIRPQTKDIIIIILCLLDKNNLIKKTP